MRTAANERSVVDNSSRCHACGNTTRIKHVERYPGDIVTVVCTNWQECLHDQRQAEAK